MTVSRYYDSAGGVQMVPPPQLDELTKLMKWLSDECHKPNANVEAITKQFFEKSNELRRRYDK